MLEKLIEKQTALGDSDARFAKRLGIPRSTWNMTRLKKRPLSHHIVQQAFRLFPDLQSDAMGWLLFGQSWPGVWSKLSDE